MRRRANKPVSWMPASAYVARRRRRTALQRRLDRFGVKLLDWQLDVLLQLLPEQPQPARNYWLLGAGVACVIAAGVLAVITR